ncbi:Ig-like domain-containing protein [Hanstruepera marina]|uniref:Ig-like domain-containing protein n=1 Tax=Hanstruepera marina TaxID=2873265 RepID=UPI001CA6EEA4|nr:Ig-like domain-containing protein [Hanstruepera marina]
MNKSLSNFIFLLVVSIVFFNCANRGKPGGGAKDITPPEIVKSEPENYNLNFKGNEIEITFDEYIKIKNLQKQLIISPPMDPAPEITPMSLASKTIRIRINDTLSPNTTYAFNFGNSIVDNNEENPFPYYKYVFSTGDYIDSLSVSGYIIDAELQKPDNFVSVMLYEVDSTLNDSVVFKKQPRYITNTLDSTTTFTLENLKAGKYMLVAMKDENQDYKFQPSTDKIGFYKSYITVPTDSVYELKLFKETLDTKIIRPRLISGEKIAFGYQGDYDSIAINMRSNVPGDFESRITKDPEADSLYYWYKPRLEVDSLLFNVTAKNYTEDFTVKISEQQRDTLEISASPTGTLNFKDNFKMTGTVPFSKIDTDKITILNADSLKVDFQTKLDTLSNTVEIAFEKPESERFNIEILPEAFEDFFGDTNDTLNYKLSTKTYADYGNVRVTLQNAVYPMIVQLTNDKGEVKAEIYTTKPEPIDFRHIESGDYYMRAIFDSNGNGKFDSGNYLKKQQPERVSHYPDKLEVRSNFDSIYEFILL